MFKDLLISTQNLYFFIILNFQNYLTLHFKLVEYVEICKS